MVLLTGLCLGSLGGMLAARLPEGEPFTGRSHCPDCGRVLGPLELVPVLSYLMQRGRCRGCGKRISPAYLVVELSTAGSFLLFYRCFGLGFCGVLHLIVAFHFCVLAGTDIMYGLLPNKILLSTALLTFVLRLAAGSGLCADSAANPSSGLALALAPARVLASASSSVPASGSALPQIWASLTDGFWGACIGFGLFYLVAFIKPGAMGGGDVKMAAVIGFYLGFHKTLPALGLAFVLSSLYCVPLLALGRLKRTDTMPLGVFLSFATILMSVITWPL